MSKPSAGKEGTHLTPVQVAVRGAAAGLAATLVLSALARAVPGIWNVRRDGGRDDRALPEDPFDAEEVREWQVRAQAPAAFAPLPQREGGPPATQPAGALTQPQGPGPEGLAEQFAFKLASGVFDRDISTLIRPAGLAVHLAYGSAWGAIYGFLQASYRLPPGSFGPLFGLLVHGVGPGWLVPAMHLMQPPMEEPPERTWMLVAGHVVYGVTVAQVFEALERVEE